MLFCIPVFICLSYRQLTFVLSSSPPDGQINQWSSANERIFYADPSVTRPPPSPISGSNLGSTVNASEQPWQRHPISVFRTESGHRASPTFGLASEQHIHSPNTGNSRVELTTTETRNILIPVSQRSSSRSGSSRPRVLRVDSFGRPLGGLPSEISPTGSHLNRESSQVSSCYRRPSLSHYYPSRLLKANRHSHFVF